MNKETLIAPLLGLFTWFVSSINDPIPEITAGRITITKDLKAPVVQRSGTIKVPIKF